VANRSSLNHPFNCRALSSRCTRTHFFSTEEQNMDRKIINALATGVVSASLALPVYAADSADRTGTSGSSRSASQSTSGNTSAGSPTKKKKKKRNRARNPRRINRRRIRQRNLATIMRRRGRAFHHHRLRPTLKAAQTHHAAQVRRQDKIAQRKKIGPPGPIFIVPTALYRSTWRELA